jgi:hypothetical protein
MPIGIVTLSYGVCHTPLDLLRNVERLCSSTVRSNGIQVSEMMASVIGYCRR